MDAIVSMTSWKLRIGNVARVVSNLVSSNSGSYEIRLNLSVDEFPGKDESLPDDLRILSDAGIIKITWVPGNTKSFKKLIPTIQSIGLASPTPVITVDDDCIYGTGFLDAFCTAARQMPGRCIACNGIRGTFMGQAVPNGCATLYRASFFTDYLWNGLDDEVISTNEDDWWYALCLRKAGGREFTYVPVSLTFFNEVSGGQYNTSRTKSILQRKI